VSTVSDLIDQAFRNLSKRKGFVERPDQQQLALLLSDIMEQGSSGSFEAPTGLGKSLAALIPAIAHGIANKKRTVIATYTNVLAEQYWRNDLPLALSLFLEEGATASSVGQAGFLLGIRSQMLMGRQRYVCLAAMDEHAPTLIDNYRKEAKLGIETEFRQVIQRPVREQNLLWQRVATPPVCPGRLCPAYEDCYYYSSRRAAERAEIVITNHSVVIQDALMARISEDQEGLLGKFNFLVLDEAHDFPQAASNGMEFELSATKLGALEGICNRLESALQPLAQRQGDGFHWAKSCAEFKEAIDGCQKGLVAYSLSLGRPGILTASPPNVNDHPQVQANRTGDDMRGARELADRVSELCDSFVLGLEEKMNRWREKEPELVRQAAETTRNYGSYIREYGMGCYTLFQPQGVAVSYAGRSGADAMLRQDVIGLAEPLRELIWSRTPYACLSATLALDGNFDFFRRTTGAEPQFEEILPTPFDYATNAALYLPPLNTIPDPSTARRDGNEEGYWRRVAIELSKIIRTVGGRTLALFHSRKEMEGVLSFMNLPPELPIYSQTKQGTAAVGERFIENTRASLFALRSFWTGFDAPGPTLSCVVLVRVPFEVPIDPPQIARLAYLQTQGLNAFGQHTLPLAKMLMRQGAGRLIRRADDKGIIAILDPRIQTKNYGEEILANLPEGMRTFRDIGDAVGWINLEVPELGDQPSLKL
jgi:ATP-dependent DNA helicase DinG